MKIIGALVAGVGIITSINANVADIYWASLIGSALIGAGLMSMVIDWN